MKKAIIMMTLVATLVGCCAKKPHYESVDEYPVKQGSLDEMMYAADKTTFSVWSPNADTVYLNLYADATTAEPLGMMAMSYGYVYVAQVAMGASPAQYFNAIKEAEAYDGPSLIIAYAPCINHGLKAGMGLSQKEEKLAVECGYWHLYRYNPALEGTDKNPFTLDSKEPDWSKFQDFLKGEVRFASLYKMYPDSAEELLQKTEEFAKLRLETYKRLAK